MWRSLVACLNGVQEAGGSSPLTQTRPGQGIPCPGLFFVSSKSKAACPFFKKRQAAFSKGKTKRAPSLLPSPRARGGFFQKEARPGHPGGPAALHTAQQRAVFQKARPLFKKRPCAQFLLIPLILSGHNTYPQKYRAG